MVKIKKYHDLMHIKIKKRSVVWQELSKYFQKEISSNSVVLDLGAGYCDFINNIKAKKKFALDINLNSGIYANKDVKFIRGSCTNLKFFSSKSVDVVFASNLFEHLSISDCEKTLKEIYRILKSKGKLIILQPNFYYCYKEYFNDYTHKTIFTHVSFMDLLQINDFKVIKYYKKFLPFSMQSKYGGLDASKVPFMELIIKIYLYLPFKPFAKQMYIISRKVDE